MALQTILLICLLSKTASTADPVLTLTDDNFYKQISSNANLLVLFYVPCGNLNKKTIPEFEKAAAFVKTNKILVVFAKMDCTKQKKICETKGLTQNFPHIHFYNKGRLNKTYSGHKDAPSIIKFARVQVIPAIQELKSPSDLTSFLKKQEEPVAVGFFKEECQLKKVFDVVAEELKEKVSFASTKNDKLLKSEGVDTIIIFRPEGCQQIEEPKVVYSGQNTYKEVKNFVIDNYYGLVGHRNPSNVDDFSYPLVIVYFSVDSKACPKKVLTQWKLKIAKVAQKYRHAVRFVVSEKEDFERELKKLDVDLDAKPVAVAVDLEREKYVMKEDFSGENLDGFVDRFLNKRLQPYGKEPETGCPAKN